MNLPLSTTDAVSTPDRQAIDGGPAGRSPHANVRRVFVESGVGVLKTWLVACGSVTILHAAAIARGWVDQPSLAVGLAIASASGIISLLALAPGLSLAVPASTPRSTRGIAMAVTGSVLVGGVAAMAIRFAGTVALWLACRYQFGEQAETLAVFVCGWYGLMTTCEIAFLARGASSLDRHHRAIHF